MLFEDGYSRLCGTYGVVQWSVVRPVAVLAWKIELMYNNTPRQGVVGVAALRLRLTSVHSNEMQDGANLSQDGLVWCEVCEVCVYSDS